MHLLDKAAEPHHAFVETRAAARRVVIVRLPGEADSQQAPTMRRALEQAVDTDADVIVIDLARVTFLDSTMLGVLLGATRQTRLRGIEMRIVVDDPDVRRIFELTLLDSVVSLYPALRLAITR